MSYILVTGATGRHGGTGAIIARRLRQHGAKVRLLVRTLDERSERLRAEGFDIATGDLHEPATLYSAVEGISQAAFIYPVSPGIVQAAASFASAMKRAAPTATTTVMSMIVAHPASPSALGRAQWLAEEAMTWSGMSLRILRVAAMFYENLLLAHSESIRHTGVIRSCFGAAKAPWIAADDAAELMVQSILHPEKFGSDRVIYPSASALYSFDELASKLSEQLGRKIQYEAVSADEWLKELLILARKDDSPVNEHMARHISAIGAAVSQKGIMQEPDFYVLERQLGRSALSLDEFIAEKATYFQQG
ncbi:NmrA family NAD(P)-binding protein [Klebsiella sp. ZJOU C1]|uniref:NmrA family NAD(P)-binding protein n=1 Tax=Klebsiella sp. ZJOU C1 TaxID=3111629 RepID=UPI002D786BDA|nr:NmrA family NAD(P)-binding protein [Klebsiella sp. ZJOU C1]WRR61816.1 NmrA family NAD(P)-binding protein [Klebsiella sp. ZJOU C1]